MDTSEHEPEGPEGKDQTEEPASQEEEGPDASELDKDPAYEPEDPNLKGIKGG
jgi:hypothetical protein